MDEYSSVVKRSTNKQYTGRTIDQSNWCGPFSFVVMTLDYRSMGTWFNTRSGHPTGIFSYRSISPPTTVIILSLLHICAVFFYKDSI